MARSAILAVLVLLSVCQAAYGHGFLQVPKSRNYIANQQGREYCHHCLSSGGPGTVQPLTPGGLFPNPETTTSAVRHTMCGESATTPAGQRSYNPSPVPSMASLPVYAPGAEFDMTVQITAHHRGHFEFRLCDASTLSDPTTVTWACLNQHVLQRVSVPGEVSPVDVNHPERYYLEPECAPAYNKTVWMKYRMPSDVTCERCVIQWWWITANSCNPPDYAKRSPQPAHVATGCQWWQSNLPVCSTTYPEEFWNCADVRIVGNATPQPAIVNTEPQPAAPTPVAAPAQPAAPAPLAPSPAASTPAPAPAQAATPAVPADVGCARLGWQCGGAGWTGSTCCQQGDCLAYIPEYSECRVGCPAGWLCNQQTTSPPPAQPAVAPAQPAVPPTQPAVPPAVPAPAPKAPPAVPKAPPTVPPTVPPTQPASQTCNGLGYQCGGSGWTGSTCCSVGTCQAYISTYSQCRTGSCPIGWLCNSEKSLMTQAVDFVKSLAL